MPQSTPPKIDWPRIQRAYAFADSHRDSIRYTHITTTLLSLFAGKDTLPVIDYTGNLRTQYRRYVQRRTDWMDQVLAKPADKADFVKKNYKRSIDVGLVHLQISQAVKTKWNPKVRIPASQQSFAYIFYAYAWMPVERMLARKELDPLANAREINDWLYLWNVLGYGMGLDARLLPKDIKQVRELMGQLRGYQYAGPGEEIPRQIRTLIRNEMEYLYFLKDNGLPIDDPTKLEIRKMLAEQISYSPGLSRALGLGNDPFAGLQNLDRTID